MAFVDGMNTKATLRRGNKEVRKAEAERVMTFDALCKICDSVQLTTDPSYFHYISDPYALMLLLGIPKPFIMPETNFTGSKLDYTCKQVYLALIGQKPISIRMNKLQYFWVHQFAQGKRPLDYSVKEILKEMAHAKNTTFTEVYHSWVLQPEPFAISQMLTSSLLRSDCRNKEPQRISPMLGIPVTPMKATEHRDMIRYPCVVEPKVEGKRIQVHKSMDEVRAFDSNGKKFELHDKLYDYLLTFKHNGLIDGIYNNIFTGIDLLQINDIWLYQRPLAERQRFFWRFYPLFTERWICQNRKEMNMAIETIGGTPIVKNLNRNYCPMSQNSWVKWTEPTFVQGRVGRRKGDGNDWVIFSEDKKILFYLEPTVFNTEEKQADIKGRVIDVDKDGWILRYRDDLLEAMTWEEITDIWDIEEAVKPKKHELQEWIRKGKWSD